MKCYPSCIECDEESIDENNQHYLSCQINKLLKEDNNNCIDKYIDGYYEENNLCKKCHESCMTCEKNGNDTNCLSCKDNKYLTNDSLYCVDIYGINYYINESEKICYKNVVKIVKNSPGEV